MQTAKESRVTTTVSIPRLYSEKVLNTVKLAKFRIMKLFRTRKKKPEVGTDQDFTRRLAHNGAPPVSRELLAKLPPAILERIFSFVCPHTGDETYESCEQSAVEDTCMLCDLRDLAHCAQVSRKWTTPALNLL
jgi:hypothetical protein